MTHAPLKRGSEEVWRSSDPNPNGRPASELPSDVATWSAFEISTAIAAGSLGAVEVLDACIARQERFNPDINAVVYQWRDKGRDRALEIDAAIARSEPANGDLCGVPMTIKEVFDWTGTPSTWGCLPNHSYRPLKNAEVVDILIDAGAVISGKTNVPAMLGDWQTFNDLHGTTNNPWDLSLSPGGSSGGSAAALATGMSALEIGSDIGGSIRFPAHYTGVFGHKPTFGIVPIKGHSYPGHPGIVDVNVAGPLARSADDLSLAMHTIAPMEWARTRAIRQTGRSRSSNKLADWKVGVVLDSPLAIQDAEMTNVLRRAIDLLVDLGLVVHEEAHPELPYRDAFEAGVMLVRSATSPHDPPEIAFTKELKRYDRGARDYAALSAKATQLTHREWIELHNTRARYQALWADFFCDYDLLLCPVAASPASPHDHRPFDEQEIIVNGRPESTVPQWFWAGWSGPMHLPSTAAPVGLTDAGLPVGIQIIAPMHGDAASIRFAQLIEWHLGGFVWPPDYESL